MIQRSVILLLAILVVVTGCKPSVEELQEISSVEELHENSPERIVWEKDGSEMVKVPVIIDYTEFGEPIHKYYYKDVTLVTVGQYKAFLKDSGFKPKRKMYWKDIYKISPTDDQPMNNVSWKEVQAYLKWVVKRLPLDSSEEKEETDNKIRAWREDYYSEYKEGLRIQKRLVEKEKELKEEERRNKLIEEDPDMIEVFMLEDERKRVPWNQPLQKYPRNVNNDSDYRSGELGIRGMVDVPKSKTVNE